MKIGIFKCCSSFICCSGRTVQFFLAGLHNSSWQSCSILPISWKKWTLEFFNINFRLYFQIFPNLQKKLGNRDFLSFFTFILCQIVNIAFQTQYMWWKREAYVHVYLVIWWQFKCWEFCLNEGKNYKVFLELHHYHRSKRPQTVSETNRNCSLTPRSTDNLPNMQ